MSVPFFLVVDCHLIELCLYSLGRYRKSVWGNIRVRPGCRSNLRPLCVIQGQVRFASYLTYLLFSCLFKGGVWDMKEKLFNNPQSAVWDNWVVVPYVYQVLFLSLSQRNGNSGECRGGSSASSQQNKKQKEMIHLFALMPPSQQNEAPIHAIQYTFDGERHFLISFCLFLIGNKWCINMQITSKRIDMPFCWADGGAAAYMCIHGGM